MMDEDEEFYEEDEPAESIIAAWLLATTGGVTSPPNQGSFDIHVQYHHENGQWWAEATRMPGWTAAADSRDELTTLVQEAIDLWWKERGIDVRWYWTTEVI